MFIVIIGCGRMGSIIANHFSSKGYSVIIIDVEEDSFHRLSSDFGGFQLLGDATEMEVLKQAKTDQADVLLVLTGDDKINMNIAQIGKRYFQVSNTIARVSDPEREEIFQQLGIKTVCPTNLASTSLMERVEKFGENKEASL